MICVNGQVTKGADDICDGCRYERCELMDHLFSLWEEHRCIQVIRVVNCTFFEDALP